jgi:hypothetical protein
VPKVKIAPSLTRVECRPERAKRLNRIGSDSLQCAILTQEAGEAPWLLPRASGMATETFVMISAKTCRSRHRRAARNHRRVLRGWHELTWAPSQEGRKVQVVGLDEEGLLMVQPEWLISARLSYYCSHLLSEARIIVPKIIHAALSVKSAFSAQHSFNSSSGLTAAMNLRQRNFRARFIKILEAVSLLPDDRLEHRSDLFAMPLRGGM